MILKLFQRKNVVKHKTLRNTYCNWWTNDPARIRGTWFEQLSKEHQLPPINFISCYGSRDSIRLSTKHKNVFWTGENISDPTMGRLQFTDHLVDLVDLSLGFEPKNAPNYIRFPVWYLNYTRGHDRKNSHRFSTKLSMKHTHERAIPCSLVARHDRRGNGAGLRQLAVDELTPVFGQVSCDGKFLNNSNILHEQYKNSLSDYLRDCKFNICFENSSGPGYTTEKLFHALAAGCVPIYWSGDVIPEPGLLEPDCYITFDPENPSTAIREIEKLHRSPHLFNDFNNQRKIVPGAESKIDDTYQSIIEVLLQ